VVARTIGRWLLAALLAVAGVGHLVATESFLAQVPPFLPFPVAVVIVSGIVELVAAVALVTVRRTAVGWLVAAWFVLVFPGNVSQAVTGQAAFGLDSDAARWGRLAVQPVLLVWALWATRAWPPASPTREAPP
jgi:uncharacterized membrane protein